MFSPEAGHGSKVFGLRFHPFDDNLFLTGGWDRCIKVCCSLAWKAMNLLPVEMLSRVLLTRPQLFKG